MQQGRSHEREMTRIELETSIAGSERIDPGRSAHPPCSRQANREKIQDDALRCSRNDHTDKRWATKRRRTLKCRSMSTQDRLPGRLARDESITIARETKHGNALKVTVRSRKEHAQGRKCMVQSANVDYVDSICGCPRPKPVRPPRSPHHHDAFMQNKVYHCIEHREENAGVNLRKISCTLVVRQLGLRRRFTSATSAFNAC